MNIKPVKVLTFCIFILLSGCGEKHIISNKVYLSKVETAFSEREKLAENRKDKLFSVFSRKLTTEQTEALKFLFAYSPLNDLADYTGDFFLANTDVALKTRHESSWGKNIPEDIFLHYVLPFRVNNENLDSFRIAYYNELKKRVAGMNAAEAALEINHWCNEKVSYQSADIRTSGPMSTILSARGRCGEESTFTVAALRTAGIPARQVYTPRWAHSDDNHAWVEVWLDGKWFYFGACEPEPVLDRGWFTEPARRAMLIHTKSFGASLGGENQIVATRNFTEVNNLSKYAVTKEIFVRVLDSMNLPVNEAIVEYQLYNYAEFYPIAMVPTDKCGLSNFETGLGDLLIWARKGDNFNFQKISVNDIDTLSIKLNRKVSESDILELDLGVPVVRTPFKGIDPLLVAENNRRINAGNTIRKKYIDSWIKKDEAISLALRTGLTPDVLLDRLSRSMGNYRNIVSFLENAPASRKIIAATMLGLVADKDLRDTPSEILSDHLNNTTPYSESDNKISINTYNQYILNPRIANEILSAWRGYFLKNLSEEFKMKGIKDPGTIADYLDKNIKLADSENYYKTPITPQGVIELKVSDSFSRNICFVAICRSVGIPSRLEPGSNVPQYFSGDKWIDVFFSDYVKPPVGKGYLRLMSTEKNPVPEYYTHFTLARFENGRYNTLEYDYNRKITDFKEELSLAPGHFMLVTGNRISDSRILSTLSFFDLKENEHKDLKIEIKKDITPAEILGTFDPKTKIVLSGNRQLSMDSIAAKGIVIIWIEPEKEPTKHIFNDLPLLKTELDNWGGSFVFLTLPDDNVKYFNFPELKGLPEKSFFGMDNSNEILKKASNDIPLSDIRLPYIVLIDKNNNIIFRSEGYRIGIGEQILRKVR
jgi:transglutaminase-like putative cysteine protease